MLQHRYAVVGEQTCDLLSFAEHVGVDHGCLFCCQNCAYQVDKFFMDLLGRREAITWASEGTFEDKDVSFG